MIGQMGGALHHAPGVAGGADAPPFAGEGDEKVMAAVVPAGAGEAIGQDPAFEETPQFPFGVGRDALVGTLLRLRLAEPARPAEVEQ